MTSGSLTPSAIYRLSRCTLTPLRVHLPEAVVAHLVHEGVEEVGCPVPVHPELPGLGVVVVLLDVRPVGGAAAYAHHPQELVDV